MERKYYALIFRKYKIPERIEVNTDKFYTENILSDLEVKYCEHEMDWLIILLSKDEEYLDFLAG